MPTLRPTQVPPSPEPLIVTGEAREVRVRHDDPHLEPYTPRGAVIRSAMELASDVDRLRLVPATAIGERCMVGGRRREGHRTVATGLARTRREARPREGRDSRGWRRGGYSLGGDGEADGVDGSGAHGGGGPS